MWGKWSWFSNSWRSFMPSCREGILDATLLWRVVMTDLPLSHLVDIKIMVNFVYNRIYFLEERLIVPAISAHTWKTGYIV